MSSSQETLLLFKGSFMMDVDYYYVYLLGMGHEFELCLQYDVYRNVFHISKIK